MSYINFNELRKARLASVGPWYDAKALIETLIHLRKINFNIVESRQKGLKDLADIVLMNIYSGTERFPNKDMIHEMRGDWARQFQQLKSALSFKSRDLRTQGYKEEETNGRGSVSDAQQAFWNSTTVMMESIKDLKNVYDRKEFEEEYGLTWHERRPPFLRPPQPLVPRQEEEQEGGEAEQPLFQ